MQAENETCFWNHRLSDGSEGAVGGVAGAGADGGAQAGAGARPRLLLRYY